MPALARYAQAGDPHALLIAAVLIRGQLRDIAGHLGEGEDAEADTLTAFFTLLRTTREPNTLTGRSITAHLLRCLLAAASARQDAVLLKPHALVFDHSEPREPDLYARAAQLLAHAVHQGVITALEHQTLTALYLEDPGTPAAAAHTLHTNTNAIERRSQRAIRKLAATYRPQQHPPDGGCGMKLRWRRLLNRRKIGRKDDRRRESTVVQLDVNPADLLRTAERYTDLAARTGQLSPQAQTEVARIAATHGPMGYPTVAGIATALANTEKPLTAKTIYFHTYSQRFTEHAANYTTQDHDAARRYRGPGPDIFQPVIAISGITPAASGGAVIVFCVPTPGGFRCTNLFSDDRSVVVYPSPTDRTGAWQP